MFNYSFSHISVKLCLVKELKIKSIDGNTFILDIILCMLLYLNNSIMDTKRGLLVLMY